MDENCSVYIIFDGLDTFSTVTFNDSVILLSDNMFPQHRVDVTKLVAKNKSLVIDFESALLRAREIQRIHPEHRFVAANGEPSRLAARKAQYHWVYHVRLNSICVNLILTRGICRDSIVDQC